MHLINIQRLVIILRPLPHPLPVMESIGINIPDDRRRVRPKLRTETVGVKAVHDPSVLLINPELIHHARAGVLIDRLKNTRLPFLMHLILAAIPIVEFSDELNPLCSRRIHPEQNSRICRMCAKIFIGVKSSSRIKFMQYHTTSSPFSLFLHFRPVSCQRPALRMLYNLTWPVSPVTVTKLSIQILNIFRWNGNKEMHIFRQLP